VANVSELGRIKVGKLYITSDDYIVRVVRINTMYNNVVFYNYHSHSNQSAEISLFEDSFMQAYKIADVARSLGRKASTIRKYESEGLLPKAKKISTNPEGKAQTRVYSQEDVDNLKSFFERRRPVGRPSYNRNNPLNKQEIKFKIDHIKMKEKLNG
jgi:hypothetical protein